MQVSDSEFNLILACLRLQSQAIEREVRSLQSSPNSSKQEIFQKGCFAKACGDLSDRLERDRGGRRIIRPNGH